MCRLTREPYENEMWIDEKRQIEKEIFKTTYGFAKDGFRLTVQAEI